MKCLQINDSVYIGVAEVKSYTIKKIDTDYFEDEIITIGWVNPPALIFDF